MSKPALTERVGGLFMAGFEGTAASDVPADLAGQLAGIILFKRNLRSAQQIRELTDELRKGWSAAAGAQPPPLIAIDQEGGSVSRLAGIGTTTPSAMALGAIGDPQTTQQMYGIVGAELAALGINLDYAPVADVNNNPENRVIGVRSFGEDAQSVAKHVAAAIRGLQSTGIAATAKHFPGHGDTATDSHADLPVIKHSLDHIRTVELVPFRSAIESGVDAIMSAHILFPAAGQDATPATLSTSLLTGLLRDELGFNGVICTDCMEMNAIAPTCAPGRAAVMAVAAGADLVLFSHTPDKVRQAMQGLRDALQDGSLQPAQVERSLERVSALRRRLAAASAGAARKPDLTSVGSEEHQAAALEAARRAVTLVRDPQSLLPLRIEAGMRIFVVSFIAPALSPVENKSDKQRTVLGKMLTSLGARVHEQTRSLDPAGHEYKQLLMASGAADVIIAVTARVAHHPLQARAVADLMMLGKPVVAVAAREPYDAARLPANMTVVAAFGDDDHALQAALEFILGRSKAPGKLPVTIAGAPLDLEPTS